ncbi:hypothetical protein ACHAWF_005289, partial [Thalassiosira exigua]
TFNHHSTRLHHLPPPPPPPRPTAAAGLLPRTRSERCEADPGGNTLSLCSRARPGIGQASGVGSGRGVLAHHINFRIDPLPFAGIDPSSACFALRVEGKNTTIFTTILNGTWFIMVPLPTFQSISRTGLIILFTATLFVMKNVVCINAFCLIPPHRGAQLCHPANDQLCTTSGNNPSAIPISSRCRVLGMSGGGDSNMPSQEEIAQQKQEAYNSLSSFHETSSLTRSSSAQLSSLMRDFDTIGGAREDEEEVKPKYWECRDGAITYSVPMDPAAGLKRGVISKPYKCSVQVEMDIESLRGGARRRGLRLVESIKFGGYDDESAPALPFVRSIPLGENVDVDAVDGSYSLDDSVSSAESLLPLLPPTLLAGVDHTAVQFLIEHTIAISESERCRCFLLYGGQSTNQVDDNESEKDETEQSYPLPSEQSYRLLGVILADETKVMPEDQQSTEDEATGDDVDYASEFIAEMIESPSSSDSPSSPLDLLEIKGNESDKMSRLMQSLEKHNERVMASAIEGGSVNADTKMERHSLGMFGITSGVWLGDTFIREGMPSPVQLSRIRQSRQKGFGKKSGYSKEVKEVEEDRFANWHMGVQKVALQFEWDYSKSVAQSFTYGKCMGTATSFSSMANIKSDGVVVVNEARPTKKREDRRVVWDMDAGQYVAGLVDSFFFRAPRYISFSHRSYSSDAFLTEFMVFYRQANELGADIDADSERVSYCSRMSRLYDPNNGRLMQGSTAFFSMKHPE